MTGANTGIGKATAARLVELGFHVLVTGRSPTALARAAHDLRRMGSQDQVEAIPLDLGDFASVTAAAAVVSARYSCLDLLVNNAGLAPQRGQRTASGFEQAFGVNHLGHFLLTALVSASLRRAASARVVTVASDAHYSAGRFAWDTLTEPTRSRFGYREYAQSKLANVLFSRELGRRLSNDGVTTYAVHPGVVASDIWRHVFWPLRAVIQWPMLTPDQGADTPVHCATAAALSADTGRHYAGRHAKPPSALAQDDDLAVELWERSMAWTGAPRITA